MHGHPLEPFFAPRGVAVFGASERADSVGGRIFSNLREAGFAGAVHPVNPRHGAVLGARAYASAAELPDEVDLAVIAVPAAQVPAVLEACGARGIHSAVVISAGFGEAGPEGRALLQRTLELARHLRVRLLGPNCLGVMRRPVRLNASFARGIARDGRLALVSQSGAICSAIVDWAEARGIGFSSVISLGAAADVGFGDLLDYLALDPETDAILLYVEGVDHARLFMSGLRAAARMKPVIVVKAGRHAASGRAAASHTGAIVGDDAVFAAALRRAGAVRVGSLHELFAAAEILSHGRVPPGERLCIVTNAGGLGVLAVDAAADRGLPLASLSESTRKALASHLPASASRDNPVDVLGDAPAERYAHALELCLADDGVDGVIVQLAPQTMTRAGEVAAIVADIEGRASKPVIACFMGGAQVASAVRLMIDRGVPCLDSPEAAVEAFATMAAYRRNQQLLLRMPEPRAALGARAGARDGEPDVARARALVQTALAEGRTLLSQTECRTVLEAFSIPTLPARRAATALEAARAARAFGTGKPVVLKIDSPDLTHKTEVAGVRLSVPPDEVEHAFDELLRDVRARAPNARLDGVIVEPMAGSPDARELLVGVARDPTFGPVIAFGAGGTLVELLSGQSLGLPPLDSVLALDLLAGARVAPLLAAFRGRSPVDREALVRVLVGVSELVSELPEVRELDLNPLLADADGAVAIDARMIVAPCPPAEGARPYSHLCILPYPKDLVREVTLRDGSRVTLRALRPEDAALERSFVEALSAESKYFRFMRATVELTPQMLVRFTQLDYDREMALLAISHEQGREVEVGVARYVAEPNREDCELALVVADAWQGRGLGSALMRALLDVARERGLLRMHGEVLRSNAHMLELMRFLGFTVQRHPRDATLALVSCDLRAGG